MMNEHGKSDRTKVPAKFANKGGTHAPAERDGGKGSGQRERDKQNASRVTAAHKGAPNALDRVRKLAKSDKKVRFTNLMHHIYNVDRLRASYFAMKRTAAAGVDGETWASYGERLEENLAALSERLRKGGYRAKPVKRTFIPKADGKQRPLGVPVLEDKIVQRATVDVLNAIYETDFLGFSYGYRPGKGQHNCLDALYVGLLTRQVNWVLDADIRGFFDNLSHEWLIKFVEHRVGDERVLRLIQKWLKAGVMFEGRREETEEGVPQGGNISPLLANVYLHYVLDLWAQQRRQDKSRGEMIIVRWADDFVVGFEHKSQAEKFLADLRERMLKFSLELHPEKTRILEFGPWAINNRKRRGLGKPETFNFLGFTHICGRKWGNKRYTVHRRTIAKKMRAKLSEVKTELRKRMHQPIPQQGKWLRSVVDGHNRYYGVPGNADVLYRFYKAVCRYWLTVLQRRGNRRPMTWGRLRRHIDRHLPSPKIHHPYPLRRMGVIT
ncbi:MAG: group II intron reverse transcriptase/maturase [Oligoflexia bacterium]|nr:group II intron reverse transcriptase/maturase [Oligoflexia bacterium]